MGIVYKGIDLVLERDVAVKVLHAHLVDKDSVRQRFEKEMQACINFKHPNVVSVFDYGYSPQNLPYMVMEYCPGKTLDEYLNAVKTLDIETFIKVFTQVSQALAYAHDKMVIHRDVKPKNIVLVEQGDELLAKLLDFGIAKGFAEANTLQKLTQTGDAIGSPYYMSPEQCKSAPLDVRSDVYSIGCVMYQAISGRVPFNGENGLTTILMHINDRCPPFSMLQADLRIPNALEQIILKCLEKNPNDRYQTARTLSDALQNFVEYFRKGERPNLEEHQRGVAENTTRQDSGVYAEGSRLNEPPSFAAQQILSLLTIAGIIKNDDVEAAMKLQLWHGGDPTQYLVELGCIDTRTHASAKQCLSLMERYSLSANDAALTLKYCYQRGISIEEALAELE
jgi:serine/threonine-protein kinase